MNIKMFLISVALSVLIVPGLISGKSIAAAPEITQVSECGDRIDRDRQFDKHHGDDYKHHETLQDRLNRTNPDRFGDSWNSEKGRYNNNSPYSHPYHRS